METNKKKIDDTNDPIMGLLNKKPKINQEIQKSYFESMMEPEHKVDFTILHQHQKEALKEIEKNKGIINPEIVSIPTGTGKTAILICAPFLLKAKRVLIIAPDLDIFKQLKDDLMGKHKEPNSMILISLGLLPENSKLPSVEAVDDTKDLDVRTFRARDIVLANADKFHVRENSEWQKLLPKEQFDLIIVDEAHHLPSEKWKRIIEHFQPSQLIFLTATPYRANGESIVDGLKPPLCNGKIIYHYKLEDAIKEKQIKKPNFISLPNAPDDTNLRVMNQVANKLYLLNKNRDNTKKYQGMLIALDRNDAENIKIKWEEKELNKKATIEIYHGDIDDRGLILWKFKNRKIDVLIVVQMLKEGFDHPPVSVIGILRRIQSPLLFTQFIGRAFRIIRGKDRKPDPEYEQEAYIYSAHENKQSKNWKMFREELLIDTSSLDTTKE